MKTVDLSKGDHSLSEILEMAKSDAVLLHLAAGEDFLIERAEQFDRELASLGASPAFMSFLKDRSKESKALSLKEVREKRGL
ncbi:MAG: hypothetical protein HY695_02955 [Deltaproteobacteria bacterium]|nr:hypothetical protein [Deltaproteobacteria bacterium]